MPFFVFKYYHIIFLYIYEKLYGMRNLLSIIFLLYSFNSIFSQQVDSVIIINQKILEKEKAYIDSALENNIFFWDLAFQELENRGYIVPIFGYKLADFNKIIDTIPYIKSINVLYQDVARKKSDFLNKDIRYSNALKVADKKILSRIRNAIYNESDYYKNLQDSGSVLLSRQNLEILKFLVSKYNSNGVPFNPNSIFNDNWFVFINNRPDLTDMGVNFYDLYNDIRGLYSKKYELLGLSREDLNNEIDSLELQLNKVVWDYYINCSLESNNCIPIGKCSSFSVVDFVRNDSELKELDAQIVYLNRKANNVLMQDGDYKNIVEQEYSAILESDLRAIDIKKERRAQFLRAENFNGIADLYKTINSKKVVLNALIAKRALDKFQNEERVLNINSVAGHKDILNIYEIPSVKLLYNKILFIKNLRINY